MEDRGQIEKLGVESMSIDDPIEKQCVRMWRMVYGNPGHSFDDARQAFWMQEPSVIDGWKRLAKKVNRVTTVATLEHLEE